MTKKPTYEELERRIEELEQSESEQGALESKPFDPAEAMAKLLKGNNAQ